MSKKQPTDRKAIKKSTESGKLEGGNPIRSLSNIDPASPLGSKRPLAAHTDDGNPNTQRQTTIELLMQENLLDGDADYIVVGKFGRTHGLDGKLLVHSYTDPIENLFSYNSPFLGNRTAISFLSHQKHGKNIVCQIEGIADCDAARRLTNQLIYLHTDQLEKLPEGEYYWHQLAGCTVVSDTGHSFGVVDYLYAGAQFPIMVIIDSQSGKTEHLIPYEPSTVKAVEIDRGQIVVDWLID